jgi:hypothetical protein
MLINNKVYNNFDRFTLIMVTSMQRRVQNCGDLTSITMANTCVFKNEIT